MYTHSMLYKIRLLINYKGYNCRELVEQWNKKRIGKWMLLKKDLSVSSYGRDDRRNNEW